MQRNKKKAKYKRVVLKISGESLMGSQKFGICIETLRKIAQEIYEVHKAGVEIAIVIGGGNFIRGVESGKMGFERVTADIMGMVATLINTIALQDVLEKLGIQTRVVSPIEMPVIAESYVIKRVIKHLEKKRIVLFACGTGSPYFSTDTAGALRSAEINADIILKGTKVDGVYDKDPEKNKDAKMFKKISYRDVLQSKLKVMDLTSISMCEENKIPIIVFNIKKYGNILKAICGENIGTIIS